MEFQIRHKTQFRDVSKVTSKNLIPMQPLIAKNPGKTGFLTRIAGKINFPAGIPGSIVGILPGNQGDNKIPTRTSGKNFPDRNSGINCRDLTRKSGSCQNSTGNPGKFSLQEFRDHL